MKKEETFIRNTKQVTNHVSVLAELKILLFDSTDDEALDPFGPIMESRHLLLHTLVPSGIDNRYFEGKIWLAF